MPLSTIHNLRCLSVSVELQTRQDNILRDTSNQNQISLEVAILFSFYQLHIDNKFYNQGVGLEIIQLATLFNKNRVCFNNTY